MHFRCDCGAELDIRREHVCDPNRKHPVKSCGCLLRRGKEPTDGLYKHPLYLTWLAMIDRCDNPDRDAAPRYHDRGITVCASWRESFTNFLADMGERPTPKHTIERMDNEGNYEPGNCRWATRKEQGQNRKGNRWITHEGRTMILADWAVERGIPAGTIWNRLYRKCLPVSRALGY